MNQQQLSQLLGRPLSSNEQTNFSLYLEIAKERLEQLLCIPIEYDSESPPESPGEGERIYEPRNGYRSLYVDPFVVAVEVKVDGETTTDYKIKQWDRPRGDWFNVIHFDEPMECEEISVTADWGFGNLPSGLSLLLARMFNLISAEQKDKVKAKSIEGFSVTYADSSIRDQFVSDNEELIDRYSQCDVGRIDHGRIPAFYP